MIAPNDVIKKYTSSSSCVKTPNRLDLFNYHCYWFDTLPDYQTRKKGRFSQIESNKEVQVHFTTEAEETSRRKPVPDLQEDQCKPSRGQSGPEENHSVDQDRTTSVIDSPDKKVAWSLWKV
ncbi:hypothetical protein TNCV_2525311 [Trichonephila clavipes]|nr:hypothetical protein TNCV_2525311 [Trichonephila clavipes]